MYLKSYSLCNTGEVVNTKVTLSRGAKIFLAFLFIEYILPLFLNLIFDTQPIFRLPIQSPFILLSILLLILVSYIALLASSFTPSIKPRNSGPLKPLPKWIIVLFSLITILVGINVFISDLSQWRYTTSILSSNLILYASVVQILMPSMSFWVLMTDHQFIKSGSRSDIIVKCIMLLGIIFSINGLGSIAVTLLFFIIFIAPKTALGFLFIDSKNKDRNFFRFLALSILLLFFIPPILEISSFAKSGKRSSASEVLSIHTNFNYLVNRHSVHLSSLAASIEDGPKFANIMIPFETAAYRLKKLTGVDSDAKKPEISSFSRLALIQFADFKNINPKGGSSPGFLASLTMISPLPLAIIATFLATFFLVKLLDSILSRQPPFSWIGAFIFTYIPFRFVTDSPLDIFIPGPVIIVLSIVLLLSLRREKISK